MNYFYCYNVVDGDTFDATPNWSSHGRVGSRVRIANINAPELSMPGGSSAKQRLESAILGKNVQLYGHSISYGRLVADVHADGVDVASLISA